MITGRSGGTGKYSYREVSSHGSSVQVSHMPEDSFRVRVVFRDKGENCIPTINMEERQAEMLWAALKLMAADLKWEDRLQSEQLEAKTKAP